MSQDYESEKINLSHQNEEDCLDYIVNYLREEKNDNR